MAQFGSSYIFMCKQKKAYEMRISEWSSDVCSSDLSTPFAVSTSHRAPRSCRQDGPYDRYPVCDLCIRPDDLDHRHHSRIWTLPGCAVVRIDRHALLRRLWRQDRELDR